MSLDRLKMMVDRKPKYTFLMNLFPAHTKTSNKEDFKRYFVWHLKADLRFSGLKADHS